MTLPVDLSRENNLRSWSRQGISLETAMATPALRAALALGAAMRHRRRARSAAPSVGAGIERSHPEHTTTTR